uniref:Ribonuclease n=1 Tax=Cyclophora tenuis TaxID=216820 RepID=A0A7S1GIL2_CYCTE
MRVLHASEISRNMLRYPQPYNLNAMSHDAAMEMIQSVLDAGVKIDTCYVDTVGIPESYRSKLDRAFEGKGINFVVEKKADSKYLPCSAASVVAKVSRDAILDNWKWTERNYSENNNDEGGGMTDFGSGYPSDPKCQEWMKRSLKDPVFCFPDLVRFSWGPAKQAVKDRGVPVEWQDDDDEEEGGQEKKRMREQLKSFLGNGPKKKKTKRLGYFEQRKLKRVTRVIQS